MDNVQAVSDLKLRAGYGISGNNIIGNYEWQGNMGGAWYPVGDAQSIVYGVFPGDRAQNDGLTWEKTKEVNIGFDFGLFKNRIVLGADYYVRTSYDLLLTVPTPVYSGSTQALMNLGKMENRGVELFLSTRNIVKQDFLWSTEFNFFSNKNKVLALAPGDAPIFPPYLQSGNPYFRTAVGHPVGHLWGYKVAGIYQNEAELDVHPRVVGNIPRPGQFYFEDVSGPDGVPDEQIDANDRTVLGQNPPKFSGGMTHRFAYKNFGLDIQLTGNWGGKTYNAVYREICRGNNGNRNIAKMMLDRWQSEENPGNGKLPALVSAARGYDNQASSYWVLDNSYLRIRNVTLSCEVPARYLNRAQISRLKVFLSVQNLYTFTNYWGYDPEANASFVGTRRDYQGSVQASGVDVSTYPSTRIYTFGINLTL